MEEEGGCRRGGMWELQRHCKWVGLWIMRERERHGGAVVRWMMYSVLSHEG